MAAHRPKGEGDRRMLLLLLGLNEDDEGHLMLKVETSPLER